MRLTVKSAAAVAALAVGMPSLAFAQNQQQQAQGQPTEAQTALNAMAGNAANWAMPSGDYANTRYSELGQINKDNVKNLRLAYSMAIGGQSINESLQATPLAEDGFLYVVDLWGIRGEGVRV